MPPWPTKKTRGNGAGERLGWAIIEMVHLMYQKKTALKFLDGLLRVLSRELAKRKKNK